MDVPTLTRSDSLLLQIATAHDALERPEVTSQTGVDDLPWIEYSTRRARLLGMIAEFLALQELLLQQEKNDKPYDEIMVQRAKLLQADIAAGKYYGGDDYSALGTKREAGDQIAKVFDMRIDRRTAWRMRPLPFSFYAEVGADDLAALPVEFVRYVLSLPRYCHLIGAVDAAVLTGPVVQFAVSRLLREEITFGNFLCESHRSVFCLGEQAWPELGMSWLPASAELKQTGTYYKPVSSTVYIDGEQVVARGLYSQASFDARFSVFTGGMFDEIRDARMYFSGSAIPACAMRTPHELLFMPWLPPAHEADTDATAEHWNAQGEALGAYFAEFYADSDIDIIVDVYSDAGLDDVLNVVTDGIAAWYARTHGAPMPEGGMQVLREQATKSYRYSIIGSAIVRPIQLFRKHFITPMGLVNSFHLACVRAYYHAGEVRMATSFIIAAMTGICVDMRYMNVAKEVADVLIKYWRRGWFTNVVPAELTSMDARVRDKYPTVAEYVTWRECWRITSPHWIAGSPLRYVNDDGDSLCMVKHDRSSLMADVQHIV